MRIFVAGAAGVIGRELVPMLVAAGHSVVGTTRSGDRAAWLRSVGAEPVILDVYDRAAVRATLLAAGPEVLIHQLTDLARGFGPEDLERNQRIRIVGTRNLVDGARAAGVRRLVAQSAAWLYADGPLPHDESHPLRSPDDAPADLTLPGILELERLVTEPTQPEGVVLRYGFVYGSAAGTAREATPLPRVSVEAAARAAELAAEGGPPGAYNVVDDDDAVSNQRARELLGWAP